MARKNGLFECVSDCNNAFRKSVTILIYYGRSQRNFQVIVELFVTAPGYALREIECDRVNGPIQL
jgi:hypothetical protein